MTSRTERRYDDREAAEILARAADAELAVGRPATPGPADGLTLAELQEIGAEAGLPADLIAQAAASVESHSLPAPRSRMLGLPVGVGRTVPLPRPLTREEWERMVASFRRTFSARGRVRSEGDLHEWSNGNLHALVEPAPDGWQLRFGTRKGDATGMLAMGSILIVFAVALAIMSLLGIAGDGDVGTAVLLSLAGIGQVGWAAFRLPEWASERERQFVTLGEEAVRLTAESSADPIA